MNIEFFVPHPARSIGGIERAVLGFERALGGRHEIRRSLGGIPASQTRLVHFHGLWNKDHLQAYRHCQRHGIPYIISPHGMLEPWAYRNRRWKKWTWLQLFGRRQLALASCVLATSRMEAEHLTSFTDQGNIGIAALGLDAHLTTSREEARKSLGLEPGDKIVLYLSRIDRKKGLDLLVQAMSEHRGYQLWIVGDGDPGFVDELKGICDARTRWIGPVWGERRWDYLLAADLFCLPTHSENFGFAILEALWAGTPVLTTNQTPWGEHAGVEGIHICEDTLDSLRDSLATLLPELARPPGIGEWARRQFHLENLADTYDGIYSAAAANS